MNMSSMWAVLDCGMGLEGDPGEAAGALKKSARSSGVAGGRELGGGGYDGWEGCAEAWSAGGDSGMNASSAASWLLPNPRKSALAAAHTHMAACEYDFEQ